MHAAVTGSDIGENKEIIVFHPLATKKIKNKKKLFEESQVVPGRPMIFQQKMQQRGSLTSKKPTEDNSHVFII